MMLHTQKWKPVTGLSCQRGMPLQGKQELASFRKINSILQGHPHPKVPGVEIATGSLGQGLSVGNGIALCAKVDNLKYRVYVLLGDGELQEGQVWEAAMSAGHHNIDNIVAIVDNNRVAQDSMTADLKRIEPLEKKFEAFGWHVIRINGHNIEEIMQAFADARKVHKPVVIIADTVKGKGVSFMENKTAWHGKAPNQEQYEQALAEVIHG
jgi:transketolase